MKNKFTKKTGPHTSTSLKKKFLACCQNSQGTSWLAKKKQHARLPAQVPASSVSSPGGNNRQERKDAVSDPEDGKHQADYRVGTTGATGVKRRRTVQTSVTCGDKRQWCLGSEDPFVTSHPWKKRREGLGGQHLADFAILPHAVCRCCRATRSLSGYRQITRMQNLSNHATDTGRESGCQNTTPRPFCTTMNLKQGR